MLIDWGYLSFEQMELKISDNLAKVFDDSSAWAYRITGICTHHILEHTLFESFTVHVRCI